MKVNQRYTLSYKLNVMSSDVMIYIPLKVGDYLIIDGDRFEGSNYYSIDEGKHAIEYHFAYSLDDPKIRLSKDSGILQFNIVMPQLEIGDLATD